MSRDKALELAGLGEGYDAPYYPGSRRERRSALPEAPVPEEGAWDTKPVFFIVQGERREFFPIGALAQALNRRPVTIRKWIRLGILPEARVRSPRRKNTRGQEGHRLWTRAQIEGIQRAAIEEGGIIDAPKPSLTPAFQQRARIVMGVK